MNDIADYNPKLLKCFYKAVELAPHDSSVYRAGMNFSQPQWGGSEEAVKKIWDLAVKNNPDASWPEDLRKEFERRGRSAGNTDQSLAVKASPQANGFTVWMTSSELETMLKAKDADRMFPAIVEGRVKGSGAQYRAQFIPFLKDMDHFWSKWNMSQKWYAYYTDANTNAGATEYSHTTFTDSSGNIKHQAIWVRYIH